MGTVERVDKARLDMKDADGKAFSSCSMHAEVVSDEPGKCPKCGMNLTPAEASKP